MKFKIILQTKSEFDKRLTHYLYSTIFSFKENREVPTKHPPPVTVKGPYAPGDSRGLTFIAESEKDAQIFAEHVMKSGFINEYWIEEIL